MVSRTGIVDTMNKVYSTSEQVNAVVPQDVLFYIEDGRNPDVYTRQFCELLQKDNQFLNGKLAAFKVWKTCRKKKVTDGIQEFLRALCPETAGDLPGLERAYWDYYEGERSSHYFLTDE